MTGRLSMLVLGAAAALATLVVVTPVRASAGAGQCIKGAKDDYKDAKATCKEDFQVAKDGCLNRDHDCVEACRAGREDCRAATGIDTAIAACQSQLATDVQNCKNIYPSGSDARATCIDNAQVAAFECRDQAREDHKLALKACRTGFRACAKVCGPANPPVDVKACKSTATSDYKTCLANSKEDFQVAKDICRNVSHACAEACRADRQTCLDPIQTQLASDIAACNATRDSAIAACNGDEHCIDQAQVVAFECRDTARENAHPGMLTCRQSFNTCIGACPPASPSGAFLD